MFILVGVYTYTIYLMLGNLHINNFHSVSKLLSLSFYLLAFFMIITKEITSLVTVQHKVETNNCVLILGRAVI